MKMNQEHFNAFKALFKGTLETHFLTESAPSVADYLTQTAKTYGNDHHTDRKLKDTLHFARKKNRDGFNAFEQSIALYCNETHIITALRKIWQDLIEEGKTGGYLVDWDGYVRPFNNPCPQHGYRCERVGEKFVDVINKAGEVIYQADYHASLDDLKAIGVTIKFAH